MWEKIFFSDVDSVHNKWLIDLFRLTAVRKGVLKKKSCFIGIELMPVDCHYNVSH